MYNIKPSKDAKPYALSLPRRVPIPLLGKVKEELQRMVTLGVIAPIDEPTEWCVGIVVVLKPNGAIRICVDLTHLNDYVCRERLILPAVDKTLAKLSGSGGTVFTDCHSGFRRHPNTVRRGYHKC